jgi:hypothetical protein
MDSWRAVDGRLGGIARDMSNMMDLSNNNVHLNGQFQPYTCGKNLACRSATNASEIKSPQVLIFTPPGTPSRSAPAPRFRSRRQHGRRFAQGTGCSSGQQSPERRALGVARCGTGRGVAQTAAHGAQLLDERVDLLRLFGFSSPRIRDCPTMTSRST